MLTVTAAIIEKNDTILIARKKEGLHLAGYWEFPGGKLEENETPEECLKRELMEEFGVHCKVGEYVGESLFDYGNKTIRLLGYITRHLDGRFSPRDHDLIQWLTLDQLIDSISTLSWAPADIPLIQKYVARRLHERNIDYYHTNAQAYVEITKTDGMQQIREKFLQLLPEKAHILDIGCGSGRDAKAFIDAGFEVTAMDATPAIAALAADYLGIPVQVRKAQDIQCRNSYHGIWACASLLHLAEWELPDTIDRLARALRPAGILYMSFKVQESAGDTKRFFHYPQKDELRKIIADCPDLQILETFTSHDTQPGLHRHSGREQWLNIIARKTFGEP